MRNWLNTYALRLIAGAALLALPFLFIISEGTDVNHLIPHRHDIQNTLTYLALLLFSYVNYTIFVPRWYLRKQYSRYFVVVVMCLLGATLIPQRIEQWFFLKPPANPTVAGWAKQLLWEENLFPPIPPQHDHRPPANQHDPVTGPPPQRPDDLDGLFPTTPLSVKLGIIFLLGTVSILTSISVQTNNRLRQVETDQLLAELSQLKAQIQPHFLFNTLNSIYALAIRRDDRTAETIVKLSEFMRYMIRDVHHDTVALDKEVQYMANYIDLQRARLRDSVVIDYTLDGNTSGKQIAPLVLFSFIENAFKYGVNPNEESVIRIQLQLQINSLRLQVYNRKVPVSHLEPSTGIGLPNARERLRLLYPAAHKLLIEDVPDHFAVDLTITLL
ncbi:sensor histidine kinase [Fibrella forsythiae]|uniref:Sensor histidine kinase n=1 Tax=Fibrella forsythiae TaxID=2817061 RepID=A0ABS3JSX9_9BACT|nr:histidine kinase [Fibrella forsythiae]MBO0952007.1 sensor histidine kinase [Fibrella forsythiae]